MKRMMAIALVAAALLTTLLATSMQAQTQPDTTATDVEPSGYLALNLKAGFALDPFVVSVNGGGKTPASKIAQDCPGFVANRPVLTVDWEGKTRGKTPVESGTGAFDVFFYSDTDSTLLIQLPDGTYLCNDDANSNLLDATIAIDKPAFGRYNIWVGSTARGQLIPGFLVITAERTVNVGNFDPGALVKRTAMAKADVTAPPTAEELALAREISMTVKAVGVLSAAGQPLTATVVSTGTVPAAMLSTDQIVCSGLIDDKPDYVVQVKEKVANLRIFFEGEQDTTLVVGAKDGDPFCSDDASDQNANPLIDIPAPKPGYYAIWVGRFGEGEAVTGKLTIAADTKLMPVELAKQPAAEPAK